MWHVPHLELKIYPIQFQILFFFFYGIPPPLFSIYKHIMMFFFLFPSFFGSFKIFKMASGCLLIIYIAWGSFNATYF